MERKIAVMHKLFGITEGMKCGDCVYLLTFQQSRRWFKCSVYGCTHSVSSDWTKKWTACGLFNKPVPKGYSSIIRTLRNNPKKIEPVDGQIDIFEAFGKDQ